MCDQFVIVALLIAAVAADEAYPKPAYPKAAYPAAYPATYPAAYPKTYDYVSSISLLSISMRASNASTGY